MLVYFFLGALLGVITGVPIGPVNVAVINSAYRHNLRRAVAVGMGGAVADTFYVLLGVLIVGHLLQQHPWVPPILYSVSGIVLIVYGLVTIRAKPVDPLVEADGRPITDAQHVLAGFLLGVTLILLNPAALVTWVFIVGSLPIMMEATRMEGLSVGMGVGVGSFLWFAFVAYLADHGKRILGTRAIWITRVVGVLLVGYGGYLLVRASRRFLELAQL